MQSPTFSSADPAPGSDVVLDRPEHDPNASLSVDTPDGWKKTHREPEHSDREIGAMAGVAKGQRVVQCPLCRSRRFRSREIWNLPRNRLHRLAVRLLTRTMVTNCPDCRMILRL